MSIYRYQHYFMAFQQNFFWGRGWEEKRALTFMPIYNHLLSQIAHFMGYNRMKWKPLIGWNRLAQCHRVLRGVICCAIKWVGFVVFVCISHFRLGVVLWNLKPKYEKYSHRGENVLTAVGMFSPRWECSHRGGSIPTAVRSKNKKKLKVHIK